jgi:translation initiation factor IF-3
MNQVLEALADFCKLESPARMEGKRMVALLAPKPGGTKPAAPKPPKASAPSSNGPTPPKPAAATPPKPTA